jgi:elongation factor 1 alpha-like protein
LAAASAGEYESSMSDGAQTREHAVLLKALGVKQVIVVVNKMDTVEPPWDPARFSRIESEIGALLAELQFPPRAVRFVPLSGLTGENLVTLSETCALREWYTGRTLLHTMNSVQPPTRRTRAPLRAVITSVLAAHGSVAKGCEVAVSVLQGTLRVGRGVGLASAAGAATAKKLLDAEGAPLRAITAGSKGTVQLVDRSNRTGEEMGLVEGMVLCKGPPLPGQSMMFKASLHTMSNLQPPIIPGSTFELYLHGSVTECRITKLYSMSADRGGMGGTTASASGKQSKGGRTKKSPQLRSIGVSAEDGSGGTIDRPKCVPGDRTAKVKIEVSTGVCIEPFKVCDALGRFALRAKGKTCAVGICEKVKIIT